MGKIAFMFPGQGAQYPGMGNDFYTTFETSRRVYEVASKVTGLDVEGLCFTENEKLNITEYTQTALLATELAILEAVRQKGLMPDYTLGLSLGEYAGLGLAEVINLEDLFRLIRKRGIYMQEAYPTGGAMSAVLGLDAQTIERICKETEGEVSIANDNCPGQIVISGEENAVKLAGEALMQAGAKRCIPLKVSGPFHSKLLRGAGEKLYKDLQAIEVMDPKIPYISNVTADRVDRKDPVKELLSLQVYSGVRFRESVLKLKALGVDRFVEIGPGKTLSGFVKKTDVSLDTINIEKVSDLDKIAELI